MPAHSKAKLWFIVVYTVMRIEIILQHFLRIADGNDWKLNVTRLEDGWFVYQLIHTFSQMGLLGKVNFSRTTSGNRRDIEYDCQLAMLKIQSSPQVGSAQMLSCWMC